MKKLNIKNIAVGWTNAVLEKLNANSTYLSDRIEERRKICSTCDLNKNGICTTKVMESPKFAPEQKMNGCGCPIIAKTASPNETCPLFKWLRIPDKEDYKLLESVIKTHDTLSYCIEGKDVVLFKNEGINAYTSIDGMFIMPYLRLINEIKNGRIRKVIIVDASKYSNYNKHATQITPENSLWTLLDSVEENEDVLLLFNQSDYSFSNNVIARRAIRTLLKNIEDKYDNINVRYYLQDDDNHDYLIELLKDQHYLITERAIKNIDYAD